METFREYLKEGNNGLISDANLIKIYNTVHNSIKKIAVSSNPEFIALNKIRDELKKLMKKRKA